MNRSLVISLPIALTIFTTSCINPFKIKDAILKEGNVKFTTVSINSQYLMNLPDYMKATNQLNEGASLQYQNIFKETYTIVIDEPLTEFINVFNELGQYNDSISVVSNYKNIQLQFLTSAINIDEKPAEKLLKINGLDAIQVELDGKLDDIPQGVSYLITFIEGKENLYLIMAWTLKDRKSNYFDTFKKSASSFDLIE